MTLLFGAGASAVLTPRTTQRPLHALWPHALLLAGMTAELWRLMDV